MSAQVDAAAPQPIATCSLCDQPLGASTTRCASCGMYQLGTGPASPFRAATLWALLGGLVLVYGITLLVVALSR